MMFPDGRRSVVFARPPTIDERTNYISHIPPKMMNDKRNA